MSKPLRYTTRSIRMLELRGHLVDIVERRITFMLTKDFLGFIDLISISPDKKIIGIQVTSGKCLRKHIEKMHENPDIIHKMKIWLSTGAQLHAHIWRKKKSGRVCDVYYIDSDLDWSREETYTV